MLPSVLIVRWGIVRQTPLRDFSHHYVIFFEVPAPATLPLDQAFIDAGLVGSKRTTAL